MQYELRDCPFCGGKAEVVIGEHAFNDVKIRCKKCFVETGLFEETEDNEVNIANAVNFWNKRHGIVLTDIHWKIISAHQKPCSHKGCYNHVSHPCESCGRQSGRRPIFSEIEKELRLDNEQTEI